jgi:hypothetical protein
MTDEIKSCHGKVPHGTEQQAQREAERRTEATGEAHEAYKCRHCVDWHVGHTRIKMAATRPQDFQQNQNTEEEGRVTQAPDIGTLAVLNKSEIDQQVATARKYPRQIVTFRREALQLATLDERTAAECIYSLPRKQFDRDSNSWVMKTIEGPSARLAEILNYAWGNTRAGARVVSEDDEFVTAQGLFYDLEKNTAISYEVQRRIVDSRGKRYSLDMIGVTSNAASSIALRNAICKGIPKALWKPIYDAARSVIAGDTRTLVSRRDEAIKAFAIFGVTPEMIYQTLGVKGIQDVSIEHMVTLKGLLTAIQEGDTTPEQAFASNAHPMGAATEDRAANLDKKYSQSSEASSVAASKSDPQSPAGSGLENPPAEPLSAEEQEKVDKRREELRNQIREIEKRQSVSGKPSEPQQQQLEDHGVPGIFAEPGASTSKRERK